MRAGGRYADLNSAPAAAKREVEAALVGAGASVKMADVAVLALVGRHGAATPLLVPGPGTRMVARALRALGVEVGVLEAARGCEPRAAA
jgi:3-hydroxyisobutyrate dehydrogenase